MLPGVNQAKALSSMLQEHPVFKFFDIVNVAGPGDEEVRSQDALKLVQNSISNNPEKTRTITLSCGRLTTGVSVPAWTAVFMLSGGGSTSVSSYLQTIFRVQTPASFGGKIKTNCFVFDFAPDRTLKMVAEAGSLSVTPGSVSNDRNQMGAFLNFCPIIGIKGSVMRSYNVDNMLTQLKRATIDIVVRNGFDDRRLYNDNLLNLTDLEIDKFNDLKSILKATKGRKKPSDIPMSNVGLGDEKREKKGDSTPTIPDKISEADRQRLAEERRRKQQRYNAISILRGISIRIPLLVFGAEIEINEEINVDNFTSIVDDKSWEEFMPEKVTKNTFNEFSKYFDNEIFVEAGFKIRRKAKAADELPILERSQSIANIFSTFRNPDRETVLTPWSAVNMHLGETLGGANFYEPDYSEVIKISKDTSTRWVVKEDSLAEEIFNSESKILEINSKTGLYPLYMGVSFYQNFVNKGKNKNTENLWRNILEENLFIICRTKMAKSITKRTLKGFKNDKTYKTNILVIENIREEMQKTYKNNYENLVNLISLGRTWNKGSEKMKFKAIVGNPPYQGDGRQQIYTDFYLLSKELGEIVSLIFPVGWQEPANRNNLGKLNNKKVKQDRQIQFIDNRRHVFPGISGAEWTNFILWRKGYDNELNGKQLIYDNGLNPEIVMLPINKDDVKKPEYIIDLNSYVSEAKNFKSIDKELSNRKPYGLTTNVLENWENYDLPPLLDENNETTKVRVLTPKGLKYAGKHYPFPKKGRSFNSYKVFVPYAWGNMDENTGLGGAYSDIYIGRPFDACIETYLECGKFDTEEKAVYFAKYLMTKFARALLYVNKYSQHSTTAFGAIPMQKFDEDWWKKSVDEINIELFKKYNVPEDVVKKVNNNIQNRYEENIIVL